MDHEKGEFDGNEPLDTLATFRKGLLKVFLLSLRKLVDSLFKGKDEVCFATNLIHESVGSEVETGQTVHILF